MHRPRRVFAPQGQAAELERRLQARLAGLPSVPVAKSTLQRLAPLLDEARRAGCRIMGAAPEADGFAMSPVLVTDATPELALLKADIFAPVLALVPARDCEEALRFDAMCPYALGASVFGPEQAARGLAARIRAGAVTVNDLIVPTADPRLPFGGRGQSGYGVTRGAEGLLELTCIKTISVRGGRLRPHHQSTTAVDEILFREYLRAAHGAGWVARIRACTSLLASLARRVRRARHLAGDTNGARGQSK